MKKTLLKRCGQPIGKEQKENNMVTLGREMFEQRIPKQDIPMYRTEKAIPKK